MSCDTHHQIARDIYPKNIQAKFNMKKYFPSYRAALDKDFQPVNIGQMILCMYILLYYVPGVCC